MLLDYILDAKQQAGKLPKDSFAVTTIVSSKLAGAICAAFGVELQEVLTGFKFIGERIKLDDEFGNKHFQFGFEESYGYLSGRDVRDKDAVVAAMLICNMAAASFEKGETLADRLAHVYEKYGYGFEEAVSVTLEGKEGIEKIQNSMKELRSELEAASDVNAGANLLGGPKVFAVRDYKSSKRYDFSGSEVKVTPIDLPKSNVLLYELGGEKGLDWACARPSGTEPKLKIYFGVYDSSEAEAVMRLAALKTEVSEYVEEKLK